ncbi:glycerophosphodiester phosphodiesterase [Halorubrum sp. JWXQ-INN 858]|nr:glycerophosphodiester phosphodiesterase [Halorubrum sp. JWXQ-INN 858]
MKRATPDRDGREPPERSRRSLLAQGCATVGTIGLTGCLRSVQTTDENPEPAVIGHRGCAAENPENTIGAVEAAAAVAGGVEVDVRRCETGGLVVFHDERLDRLTTEGGRVANTSCDAVVALDVDDSGETVPTLAEVFEAVPADTRLVLDLKEPGLTADVLALSAEHDHELLLSSFLPSVLREVRAVESDVSTAYIVRESAGNRPFRPVVPGLPSWVYLPEDVAELIRATVELGCDAIHPRYELCLQTDLVTRAHAAGLRVEAWTITGRDEFAALRAVGVDAVISDVCTDLHDGQ